MDELLQTAHQLHTQGKIPEAITRYREILTKHPERDDVQILYGFALVQSGNFSQALSTLESVPQQTKTADVYSAISSCHQQLGNIQAAITALQNALAIQERPELFDRLSRLFIQIGSYAQARDLSTKCVARYPEFLSAQLVLAVAYMHLDQTHLALGILEAIHSDSPVLSRERDINLANAHRILGNDQNALSILTHLLENKPDDDALHVNRGHILKKLGKHSDAQDAYQLALKVNPHNRLAQWNLAQLTLGKFQWDQGWKLYQVGKSIGLRPQLNSTLTYWQGQPLHDIPLLLICEQGLGEEILFASCFADVASLAPNTTVACDPRLIPLFSTSFPEFTFVSKNTTPTTLSKQTQLCLCGDLPAMFRQQLADFPKRKAWLKPPQVDDQCQKLSPNTLNIGFSWQGGKNEEERLFRSIPLPHWHALFGTGHNWISLQYDFDKVHSDAPENVTLPSIDVKNDIAALAHLINQLDVVITIDNSIAHLAAALGKPTWVLLPASAYWVWGEGSEATPWYPSATLIRQNRPYAWSDVIKTVGDMLLKRS
ncbi:MAG: tetratricopeptide repeat protein [Gammaproteobacteria bacterium]|nr:tetratricopeptide repeat protein [Gammaproteobacteria bacterium]